jgi:alpha-1,2-mannosyltransferase
LRNLFILALSVFLAGAITPGDLSAMNPQHYEWLRLNGQCVGCDFSDGDLRREELGGRNMRDADVSGADLRFTNLKGADLRGARFINSNLVGADLTGAQTEGANFSGAVFCLTIMPDGSDRSDECLEGVWRETGGGVILIGHNPTRQKGAAYKAIVQSGAPSLNSGDVIMKNFVRQSPGVYPPLWAAIAAPLTGWISPQPIFMVATVLNPLLLVGLICLAWRAARPAIALRTWLAFGILAMFPTLIGSIALHQNQPQILVSFLIVLALERSRSGDKITAGTAMAQTASIKLYPFLFIIVWLARRDWVTVKWFSLTGALLVGASLWLGGVALNLTFLRQIATINDTVMLTQLTTNLDSLLGQFLLRDTLVQNAEAAPGLTTSTGVHAAKPFLFGLISKFALLLVLVATWRHARRVNDTQLYQRLWPSLLLLVSIFSPLSWAYHFIGMGAFLPLLLVGGMRSFRFYGTLAVLFAISIPGVSYLATLPTPFFLIQVVATLGFAFLAVLFLLPTAGYAERISNKG